MSDFERAATLILKLEGGDKITDDPKDPGGLTKFGISAKSYPDTDIRNLTEAQAKAIYRRDYWDRITGDDLPWPINLLVFDGAVNCGVGQSVKWLQRAVGSKDDGGMGPQTLAAVRRQMDPRTVCRQVAARRLSYYEKLPGFERFGKGWQNRLEIVRKEGGY